MNDSNQIILEQYKLFVEMADRISQRRLQVNQYYVSLISGLLVVIAFLIDKHLFEKHIFDIITILPFFGCILCIIWQINTLLYKKLNATKFKVIMEIEKKLPISCYSDEWNILTQKKKKYISLSNIENLIPISLFFVFHFILIYSIL